MHEMYKPVRPRPKKTDIVRSRGGCRGCRERRKKCDERKPSCSTCLKIGRLCQFVEPDLKFRIVDVPKTETQTPLESASMKKHSPTLRSSRICPLLPPIRPSALLGSLSHTEEFIFYSTYWEDVCLPAVHPVFRSASLLIGDHPMLSDAIMALSSCNLSRLRPDSNRNQSRYNGASKPDIIHQRRSQTYYSSAIRKFAALNRENFQSHAELILTTLVLFSHIESSMGNKRGFYCHVHGLASLFVDLSASIKPTTLKALLISLMQVRFGVWWARSYFCSLEIHRDLPPVPLPNILERSYSSQEERRVVILGIMCESHRLNFAQLFRIWSHLSQIKQSPAGDHEPNIGSIIAQLEEQAKRSDEWILHLPPSEQPIGYLDPPVPHFCDPNTPVVFQSHDAALNFAYYVVGRMMQSSALMGSLQSGKDSNLENDCSREEPWVHLLLRIAQGIDLQTSITKNNYTVGFSGLLLAAILRCDSLALSMEIQHWLGRLKELQPTEEGAFPVNQSFGVVKAINNQRLMGRQVFGVTQLVDDAGGNPKYTSYNSQSINTLLFHGRCQATGGLFTEPVSIEL
ncbi:unnamed protein product [Penicillium salamii]|nr:unnamed protein product [Penicillium salamii]